ncbi:MAG: hypothetical protein JKY65_32955 [Planctomycetes bacterium]|nr:hypothetical protein [Planctomycetota bacterium]
MTNSPDLPNRLLKFAVTGALLAGAPGCPADTTHTTNPRPIPQSPTTNTGAEPGKTGAEPGKTGEEPGKTGAEPDTTRPINVNPGPEPIPTPAPTPLLETPEIDPELEHEPPNVNTNHIERMPAPRLPKGSPPK